MPTLGFISLFEKTTLTVEALFICLRDFLNSNCALSYARNVWD